MNGIIHNNPVHIYLRNGDSFRAIGRQVEALTVEHFETIALTQSVVDCKAIHIERQLPRITNRNMILDRKVGFFTAAAARFCILFY